MIRALDNCGAAILGDIIDITKAKLGNKTWGYIDYLINHKGFKLDGEIAHRITNNRLYYSDDEFKITRSIKNKVEEVEHSYDLIPVSKHTASEHVQYREIMRLQEKFNPKEVYESIKGYKNKINKHLARNYDFQGETIYQSEFSKPKRQKKD